jgi:hypothetical protein
MTLIPFMARKEPLIRNFSRRAGTTHSNTAQPKVIGLKPSGAFLGMSEETSNRTVEGKFVKGMSGNPSGRPKGSKNQLTLLKQSLEVQLREQAAPELPEVMQKAVELALAGDRTMIKLLLELHMSKGIAEDREVRDQFSITIGTHEAPEVKNVIITKQEGETDEEQPNAHSGLSDPDECEGDSLSGAIESEAS